MDDNSLMVVIHIAGARLHNEASLVAVMIVVKPHVRQNRYRALQDITSRVGTSFLPSTLILRKSYMITIFFDSYRVKVSSYWLSIVNSFSILRYYTLIDRASLCQRITLKDN